jgi:hypothetical protein
MTKTPCDEEGKRKGAALLGGRRDERLLLCLVEKGRVGVRG